MIVLAIDTSHAGGSATVLREGAPPRTRAFGTASSHLVELAETVRGLLRDSGIDLADVERVAWASGPGSFTGLRIGLAFVKGLYAGLRTEVVALSTLELLAAGAGAGSALVCPMIDARRNEVYAALYRETRAGGGNDRPPRERFAVEVEPCASPPAAWLEKIPGSGALFLGSGAARYRRLIEDRHGGARFASPEDDVPSTERLARLAPALTPLNPAVIRDLEPFYLRPSDAKVLPLRRLHTLG